LEQQNELEREKITKINNSKNQRKRNTLILIFIVIVFFGMMYRQYRVKRQLLLIKRIDLLTGLYNRQALFYLGKRLFKESQEDKRQLSVIYFDCDDFKKINDDYGSQIVDEILKVITTLGNDVMRSRDVFARIGSQEFVILLPEDNLAQAKAVAEHLREKIAQYDYSSLGIKEGLSASFGIVSNDKITSDFESLLKAANFGLLKAKEQGGNKAVCFEESFCTSEKLSIRTMNSAGTEQKS
jgi:diguanylate cyclase (GGDEF)-like protein